MTYVRRTWVEIDAHALAKNIDCYKKIIGPDVMLALVVKTNAYGHGMLEIARLVEHNKNVDMLHTVMLSEALALRAHGIKKPIAVLGIIDDEPACAITHDIELLVSDYAMLDELNKIACSLGKICKIHIKVDTGLSRLGIYPEQVIPFLMHARTLPNILINGICSHFAEAGSTDQGYTQKQYDTFVRVLQLVQQHGFTIAYRHITNSAASTTYDLSPLNMIRVAAGPYGLYPSQAHRQRTLLIHPYFHLDPVLSWHTRICHIKTLPAGTPVSYERTYVTRRETIIGLLPVGYGDGYDKRLSNKSVVYIPANNTYVPVLGRIAMNMTTIDITDIPNAYVGQEVVLVGKQEQVSPNRLAELSECHNAREITLRIDANIPRIVINQQETTEKIDMPYTNNTANLKGLEI